MIKLASLKEPEKKTLAERLAILDQIADRTNAKHKKVLVGRIGKSKEIMDRLSIKFIPTPSYEVNAATGGGFPRRRCTIIAGGEDSGKTSLALETIAKAMMRDPEFIAVWLESENSLEKNYMIDTFKIDPERFFFIGVDAKTGAEEILDTLYNMLAAIDIDICVINTLRCLIPIKEKESSLGDPLVAVQARMNSRFVRKFTSIVAEYNTAFIIIQQMSTDVGGVMMRDPMVIAGGVAIKHWSSLTLVLRKNSLQASDPIDKDEGMKFSVTVKKNHCTPSKNVYVKTFYYIIFGQGTEQLLSTLDRACRQGRTEIKGSWVYWYNDKGEIKEKWNGRAQYRLFMMSHPEVFDAFQKEIDTGVQQLSEEEIAKIKEEEAKLDAILEGNEKVDSKSKASKKSETKENKAPAA